MQTAHAPESPSPQALSLSEGLFRQHDPGTVWTVSEVSNYLTRVFRHEFPNYFWLCGELVLNDRQSGSPHLYASLRDETGATLPLVSFNGSRMVQQAGIRSGDRVFAYGHLDIYPQRCSVQFLAQKIQRVDDKGTLTEIMRKSLARLVAEGLTDAARKKPIPPYPRCIGIVTSPDAAGYRDFLHTCLSRFPRLAFRLAPSKVQGDAAPAELIEAIRLLDECGGCDLIVVTRGGGSVNDLWCFNDESLARAVASAKTPIVTAIGHERDTTLVDYVSDLNAITPTKAAEVVTQNLFLAAQALESHGARLRRAIRWAMDFRKARLLNCQNARHLVHPQDIIDDRKIRLANDELRLASALPHRAQLLRQEVDSLRQRLNASQQSRIVSAAAALQTLQTALRALDPKGVLQRGYSILMDEAGHAIRETGETAAGARLTALLGKGSIRLTVDELTDEKDFCKKGQ